MHRYFPTKALWSRFTGLFGYSYDAGICRLGNLIEQ